MDYFNILNLVREPFSNSPDPEFFYQSREHLGCLQQLEISIRLRRGLNVVIGDVGIGKTTICRQLIRRFADNPDTETHLILDPHFGSQEEFVTAVAEKLDGEKSSFGSAYPVDAMLVKERIKQYLFRRGVHEKKNVILIIDEGQKLPSQCLEILREFLNYETNKYKLLQIIIFAQPEFENTIRAHAYFADRINFFHRLKPLNFSDTRAMIRFRVFQSGDGTAVMPLFSYPAFWAIYRATGGYPRKIVNLCHQCVVAMIIQNRNVADWLLVRDCIRSLFPQSAAIRWRQITAAAAACIVVVLAVGLLVGPERITRFVLQTPPRSAPETAVVARKLPPVPELPQPVEETTEAKIAALPAISKPDPKADPLNGIIESDLPRESTADATGKPAVAKAAPASPRPKAESPAMVEESKTERPRIVTNRKLPTTANKPSGPAPQAEGKRYTIQVGAFRVAENASRMGAEYQRKGYPVYMFETRDGRSRHWYTVRIGEFKDLKAAYRFLTELKAQQQIAAFITHKGSLTVVSTQTLKKQMRTGQN